jgi:hypothetical protein
MNLIPAHFDVSLYNHQSPLNNFCPAIPHDKFREIASVIEKEVDRKNKKYERELKISRYYPVNIYRKIISEVERKLMPKGRANHHTEQNVR